MPDWNAIFGALIPAGVNVAGAIGANRAQASGINLSQDALNQAKAEAAAAYGQGAQGAAGALTQGQQNAQSALDWGYGTAANQLGQGFNASNQILPWGYQQGNAARATGLANSLGALGTGYGNAFNILNPYAQSGVQALNQANFLTFGKGTPGGGGMPQVNAMPQTQFAPQLPMPSMPKFGTGGIGGAAPMPAMKTNALSTGALGGGGLGTGGTTGFPDPSGTTLATQSLQNSNVRGAEGALAGIGVGAGLSALGLATAAIPLLAAVPFVGPILAGVGALIGKLWNNHNPDKTWASNAINEVSQKVWGPKMDGTGGLAGEVKNGTLTPAQAKTAFQGLWQGWIQAMHNAGVDQSIIDRSIQSQSVYFKSALDGSAFDQAAPPAHAAGGGMIPGQDQGHDTVPAMLRGGEFVFTPEAVRHWGVAKLQQMNQKGLENALSNPQHFATGGTVQPYDPTNPNKTQDWTQQLDPSGALPAGYSSYVQGFNPLTQQWEYNPNTGDKYVGGDTRGVAQPYVAPANTATPSGAPTAGDPNYYKYVSVGGSPYQQIAGTTPTSGTASPPSSLGGANFNNDTQDIPTPTQTTGSVPSRTSRSGSVGGVPPPTGSTTARTGGTGQSISSPAGQQTTPTPTRGEPIGGVWAGAPQVQAAVANRQASMGLFTPQATPTQPGQAGTPGTTPVIGAAPTTASYTSPGGPGSVGPNQEQFPSNWNANNAPMPGVLNMTGANGATYETSPLYQWQLQQGEKNINRALQARGRSNSSYGLNTLANFYNALGANEAQQNYNRTMDMTKLGLEASLAQAQQQGQYGSQASAVYQAAAQGDAQAAQTLATQLGVSYTQYSQLLATLTQKYGGDTAQAQQALGIALAQVAQWNAGGQAQNTWNWANPYSGNAIQGGQNNAGMISNITGQNWGALLKTLGIGGTTSTWTPNVSYDPNTGYGYG
jgi:hypothetical protein